MNENKYAFILEHNIFILVAREFQKTIFGKPANSEL